MDIKFIRDDSEERAIKELNQILDVLSEKRHEQDVYAARKFILAMIATKKPVEEGTFDEFPQAPTPPEPVVLFSKTLPKTSVPFRQSVLHFGERPVEVFTTPQLSVFQAPTPSKAEAPKRNFQFRIPSKIMVPTTKVQAPVPKIEAQKPKVEEKEEEIPKPSKEEEPVIGRPFMIYESKYPLTVVRDKNGVAIVRSSLDKTGNEMVYRIIEPAIDSRVLDIAKGLTYKDLMKKPEYIEDEKFMGKSIAKALKKAKIPYTDDYAEKVKYFLKRDIIGFGKIDALLQDQNIKSIVCDGIDKPVRVYLDQNLEIKTDIVFSNLAELNSFVKALSLKVRSKTSDVSGFEGMFENWKVEGTFGFESISPKFVVKRLP